MFSATIKKTGGLKDLLSPRKAMIGPPLAELLKSAIALALSEVQRAAGPRLRSSFYSDAGPSSSVVRSNLHQAFSNTLETGRTPGATPPPAEALAYIDPDNTFALARSVSERGQKGRFFRKRAEVALNQKMATFLADMGHKMELKFGRK